MGDLLAAAVLAGIVWLVRRLWRSGGRARLWRSHRRQGLDLRHADRYKRVKRWRPDIDAHKAWWRR